MTFEGWGVKNFITRNPICMKLQNIIPSTASFQLFSQQEKSSKFPTNLPQPEKLFIGRTSRVEYKMWKILFQLLFAFWYQTQLKHQQKIAFGEINNFFVLGDLKKQKKKRLKSSRGGFVKVLQQRKSTVEIRVSRGDVARDVEMMENSYNKFICGFIPQKSLHTSPTERFTIQWLKHLLKKSVFPPVLWKVEVDLYWSENENNKILYN